MEMRVYKRAFKICDIFVAFCTYTMGAYFNFALFSQQGGEDLTLGLIYGILGIVFDMMKVTFTVEGLRKRQAVIIILAIGFSVVSLTSSALNMLGSWNASIIVQAGSTKNIQREALEAKRNTLQEQIKSEQLRLLQGGVQYRTDAEHTRESISTLQKELDSVVGELLSIPQETIRDAQRAQGFFGAIPTSDKNRDWLNLGFRFLITILLELGGWASIYLFLSDDEKKRPLGHSSPFEIVIDHNGLTHYARSITNSTAHTFCSRAFEARIPAKITTHITCPECIKKMEGVR